MSSPSSKDSKRRSAGTHHQMSAEDQALNMMAQEADSRLNTTQAVLAEARSIRSKELQRIRRETAEADDEDCDETSSDKSKTSAPVQAKAISSSSKNTKTVDSSNKSTSKSKDSSSRKTAEEHMNGSVSLKAQFVELENKYKKVMMTNAQLDNEKLTSQYEKDLLKDRLEDLTEQNTELNRLLRIRAKELEEARIEILHDKQKIMLLQEEVVHCTELIEANGLKLVSANGPVSPRIGDHSGSPSSSMLIPQNCIELLKNYEGSSLGEKLQKLVEEKQAILKENKRLEHKLELERSRLELRQKYQTPDSVDGAGRNAASAENSAPSDSESQKNFTELKLKLKRAEQEITTLQGSVTRLESQVNRYKSAAESSEKAEEQLKQDRKTLRSELREQQKMVDDLTSQNNQLTRRIERLKASRNLTTDL